MSLKHRVRKAILPAAAVLLRWLIRALCATYRLALPQHSQRVLASMPSPSILVCWHDQMLLSAPLMLRHVIGKRPFTIMASHSDDGELIARLSAPLGVQVIRGSASRGGREGLRKLQQDLVRRKSTLLILPDGPRGPAHVSKPGFLVLSQLARAPVVPVAFATDRCWKIGSWDRLVLPYPWARVSVRVGEPIDVPRQLSTEHRDRLNLEIQDTLQQLTTDARQDS